MAKTLLLGDLNAKHSFWNNNTNNTNGNTLYQYLLDDCTLQLHYTTVPTFHAYNYDTSAYVDIGISKGMNELSDLQTEMVLNADHLPIYISWTKYRKILNQTIIISDSISDNDALEKQVQLLTNNIQDASKKLAKKIHSYSTTYESLPQKVVELIKNKNKLRKSWQNSRDPETKKEINKLTDLFRTQITTSLTEQRRRFQILQNRVLRGITKSPLCTKVDQLHSLTLNSNSQPTRRRQTSTCSTPDMEDYTNQLGYLNNAIKELNKEQMASTSNTSSAPSYASVAQDVPIKFHAIVLDTVEGLEVQDYAIAISKIVEPKNITHISRISHGRVVVYLKSKILVDDLTGQKTTINIGVHSLEIRPLVTRAKRILI
ncbi:hypothetical protein ABEB36_003803 [Hypothenemus hampei]|uniref:Endonuclease/exonuclease/phosphatase domain-containing protein n=1 Tax=Hypothenemus hampei TaxID=57062 RepID=A0ABD1F167_HYPHA